MFNRRLKQIGKRLQLPVPLTSYVFRQALRHTSEKMTHHYQMRGTWMAGKVLSRI